MRDTALPWLSLLLLGAAHGINPAMGWLFAVGRGLQERDRRALWRALGPLALGHALAIAAALLLAITLGQMLPLTWLRWVVAAALLAVGIDGLVRHRHVRLSGMHVSARELTTWSFLMASAHGAGLMVLPFVLGAVAAPVSMSHHHHMMPTSKYVESRSMSGTYLPAAHGQIAAAGGQQFASVIPAGFDSIGANAITAPVVHTLGYLAMTALIAVVIYEKVGLRILRRAWINLNLLWSAAMIGAAAFALLA